MRSQLGDSMSLLAFVLLLLLLVWLPIPWGSNRPWSSYLMSGAVSVILMIWSASRLVTPARHERSSRAQTITCALFGIWWLYLALQVLPLPGWLLQILSTASYESYRLAGAGSGYLSVDVAQSKAMLLRYGTYVVLFVLTWKLVNTRTRLLTIIITIFGVGVAEAILGMGLWTAGKSLVPHSLSQGHWARTTGTFVNRNHYACLLAMTFCTGIGYLIMTRGLRLRSWNTQSPLISIFDNVFSGNALVVVGLILILCALLLSGSVGAFTSLFIALICMFLLSMHRMKGVMKLAGIGGITIAIAGLAVVLTGGGRLFARVAQGGISLDARIEQWIATLKILPEFLFFGVGAGNYSIVFPGYHDASLPRLHFDHVHNDYLELLVNQGLLGFGLLATAIVFVITKLIERCRRCAGQTELGAVLASCGGLVVMLVHGMVEFNFYIPANAAYFFVFMGVGMSVLHSNFKHRKSE